MAKRELLVTLGLDATTYAQEIKRANQLNKEFDNAFKLLSSSSEGFEKTLEGLAKKQDYLADKMKLATELSDTYTKRIKESKEALDETIKQSEKYKKTLDELNEKKDKGITLSKQEKQTLKETQQLYDKAQKSIVTYNTQISEATQGYDKTQTKLQELNREFTKSVEIQKNMGKDFFLEEMREEISKAEHDFKLLSSSTENFNKTFTGLVETQKHYENQSKNINKLMDGLQQQIEGSNNELKVYKERIEETNEELRVWESLLKEIDKQDPEYDYTTNKVEQLRKEYSELNAIIEVHEDRTKKLSSEYKQNQVALVDMTSKVNTAKEKIKELSKVFEFDSAKSAVDKFTDSTISALEKELEKLEDDFTNVTNEIKDYENSLQGLDYKQKYLNKSLEKTESILSEYEKELEGSTQATKNYEESLKSLERQIEINAELGKQMVDLNFGRRAEEQAKIVKELKEKYKNLTKEYENHQSKVKENEKAYKDLKQQLSSTKGEITETANSADKLSRSLSAEKLERELDRVTSKFDELDSQLRLSVSKLEGLDRVFKRVSLETDHLSDKIELSNRALKEYENSISHTSSTLKQLEDDYEHLNKELVEHKNKLEKLNYGDAGYDKAVVEVNKLEIAINELDSEIAQHEQKLSGLEVAHNNLQAEINETIREQQQLKATMTGDFLENFGNQLQTLGSALTSLGMTLMPLTLAIGAVGKSSIETGTEFYQSMSKVQAISNSTGSEFEKLTAKAREMGALTIWSSTDSAEALNYMALAGWNAQEMMDGLGGVLNLASAGNTDLALTSDIVTDGLTAMGMSAKDATHYADVMAQTMSSSNTTIELMGETMKYAGAVAGGLGISLEDLSLATGIMANSGIKGSMAGTALRAGLTRLIAPTDKAKSLMKQYGIEVKKTTDGNVDLRSTMEHLQDKMSGLSVDTQNMIAKHLFGQTAMNGWLTIINADKQAFNDLALAIDTSAGSADRMAETMTNNLWGDLQELESAVEESLLSIFDAIEPFLRKVVQAVTNLILDLTDVFKSLSPVAQRIVVIVGGLMATLAPLLVIFGTLANLVGSSLSGFGELIGVFGKFKNIALGLNGAVSPLIVKIASLGLTFLKLTSILAAVGIAFGIFYKNMQEDAIESVDVITEGVSDATKALVDPFLEAQTEIDSIMLQMSSSNVAVTKDMVDKMSESLGQYADNTVSILENSQKNSKSILEKNMKELTDSNTKDIENMKTRVDEIYKTKIKNVQDSQKAIMEIQKKAQEENRGLNVSERNAIDNHYKEIKKISLLAMGTLSSEMNQIQKNMQENEDALNAEAITKALKSAKEKKESVVNEATNEYNLLVGIQKNLSNDLTSEEKNKLDTLVGLAKNKKDETVKLAEDEYGEIISNARRLAKDMVHEIDWSTGEVKTKWQVMTDTLGGGLKKVLGDFEYEWQQAMRFVRKFGLDIDIMSKKWEKLWTKDKKEKASIQADIDALEQQKKQLVKLNDEIIASIDRIQDLPADLSAFVYELDSTFVDSMGITLADFANDVDGHLSKAKEDFTSLPPEVRKALANTKDNLLNNGVKGGLEALLKYIQGDLDNIRSEFSDLPEDVRESIETMQTNFELSADKINGISFDEFVIALEEDVELATEIASKLPEGVKKELANLSNEDWNAIFNHFSISVEEGMKTVNKIFGKAGKDAGTKYKEGVEESKEKGKKAGEDLGNSSADGAKSTKEKHKEAGKENSDAYNKGTKSKKEETKNATKENAEAGADGAKDAKESYNNAGKENSNAYKEGFNGGLQDLPDQLKQQLQQAGVTIQEDGQIIVQDFEKTGRDAVTGFVNELNSQLPQLDGVTIEISERLGGIDNVRLGNVTKQLSEVNRWLGVVQQKAVVTNTTMSLLTKLKWGNTTKGLSETNNWLMRTTNRSKDTRSAMVQLTNLPFGNTTRGLSEVNNWLMRTTNRSKDTQKALKSVTDVTYGKTTKGLSEVNKWLTTVKTSANNAKTALSNITNVTYGGVTKGLSEINKWLNTVKNTASGTKSALYAVAQAKARAATEPATNLTSDNITPQVPNALTRDSWLDFGDITKYKTGGGFYNPTRIATQSNIQKETNNNSELLKTVLQQNQLLIQLLTADRNINVGVQVDGRQIAKASARYIEEEMNTLKSRSNRLGGKF